MVMMPSDALIAIVDDDASVARAVSRALETRGYRVCTFGSGQEFLSQRGSVDATCILADIRMQDVDGMAMFDAIRAGGARVPTIFMTGSGDIPTVVRAMKAGATDLLAKPFTIDNLLTAIDTALVRAHSNDDDARQLASLWRACAQLTPREAEVAALVATGRLNKQVAATLGITEKTVKVHRGRAMRKLHADSVAELVRAVDRILSDGERAVLHVDGVDVQRPATITAMRRALMRTVATKA